jgi:hypothetical protein
MPETYQPINITWTQQGAESYNWTIPAEAVAAITAYIANQTMMESVPMTDPDGRPYTNSRQVPRYTGVGDYIIQTLMSAAIEPVLGAFPPAAVAALEIAAREKADEAKAARRAAMTQVLIPACRPD